MGLQQSPDDFAYGVVDLAGDKKPNWALELHAKEIEVGAKVKRKL